MGVHIQVIHPGSEDVDWRVRMDDDESPWLVFLNFVGIGAPDSPEWLCAGYELRRREDVEPSDVRAITADDHRHVAERWERFVSVARSALEFSISEAARETGTLRARGRGRRGLPDEFFRGIADQYRQAHARNNRPTSAIAEAHDVSRSTASNWVAEARKRGYLEPATPGRAG